jgi:hypothetical protein
VSLGLTPLPRTHPEWADYLPDATGMTVLEALTHRDPTITEVVEYLRHDSEDESHMLVGDSTNLALEIDPNVAMQNGILILQHQPTSCTFVSRTLQPQRSSLHIIWATRTIHPLLLAAPKELGRRCLPTSLFGVFSRVH